MTRDPRRSWLVVALVAAVVVLVGSVGLASAATGARPGRWPNHAGTTMHGSMSGGSQSAGGMSMMGAGAGSGMGRLWLAGDGIAVTSIASARQRATHAAVATGLHPGEVIRFDNGFYVELKDSSGAAATEVIIDPGTGSVTTEPGPAMMWNTRYGMHAFAGAATKSAISAEQAQQIANRWLRANLPGRLAAAADNYPGYYSLETTANGQLEGMLSVNAGTGAVWAHTWHGRLLAKEDS